MNINPLSKKKLVNYRFIIPAQIKLLICFLIVFLSWYSGAAQAAESLRHEPVFVRQLSVVSSNSAEIPVQITIEPVKQIVTAIISGKQASIPTVVPHVLHSMTSVRGGSVTTVNSPGNASSFLDALNVYRQKNGKAPLQWNTKLGQFAQSRAELFNSQGKLDYHAGFNDYIHNQDGFHKLGFYSLGENSGYGQTNGPIALIEDSYGHSPAHNQNQLSSDWSDVGIGISGTATDFVFGGHNM